MAVPQHSQSSPDRSDQIEETVRSIVEIHEEHARRIGFVQKLANRITSALGRPGAVLAMVVLMLLWIAGNVVASQLGVTAPDPLPAPELNLFGTVCAFLVTLLILTTQRHEQEADRRRDQLTLHMAVLTEKKIAKVIALLEEQRRDNPLLTMRRDSEAEAMAKPSDPRASLDRIEDTTLGE